MVRLGSTQNPASKEKGHWPQEEPCSSHVKGRGAWPGLREPLPWRKRGVKAGPGARLGDIGLEVSLFGGMLSGSTWDFIRFCFLNWLGLGTGFILCAYNFFFLTCTEFSFL